MIAALYVEELRSLVRSMLLEFDHRAYRRVIDSLLDRVARGRSGWIPAAINENEVAEVLDFAKGAERNGSAEPADVDVGLGTRAFLRRDYESALRIDGALLPPIGDGDIDLGQRELVASRRRQVRSIIRKGGGSASERPQRPPRRPVGVLDRHRQPAHSNLAIVDRSGIHRKLNE